MLLRARPMPESKVETAVSVWAKDDGFYFDQRLRAAGISHGVTTRVLGSMRDAEGRRVSLRRAGAGDRDGLFLKQVHGSRIVALNKEDAALGDVEADGWIGAAPQRPICVFIADCVPLFVWAKSFSVGGVFHVGWRGAHAQMPGAAVNAFREHYGVAPGDLQASVGPHIGACCYPVGSEVAGRFDRRSLVVGEGGDIRLDLGAEVGAQLMDAGVAPSEIGVCRDCTSCLSSDFYSYRREKRRDCMMAFLILNQ